MRNQTGVTLRLSTLIHSFRDSTTTLDSDVDRGAQDGQKSYEEGLSVEDVTPQAKSTNSEETPSGQNLLLEGLKIMAMDVSIQFTMTLGVYLSLVTDGAEGYQIASMQSAIPTYGIAYAIGIGLMLKIIGSQLIASKKYRAFATFARITGK